MGLDICHAKPSLKADSGLDYFTVEELKDFPDYLNKYKDLLTEVEIEKGKTTKALFFSDLYIQRKRMNKEFIHEFDNCKPYFDIDSVKLASKFLEAREGEDQTELQKTFKENFIDNFVEGESVFYISW